MTEGVVAKWHKKIGDKVKSGDLLADIETDKATMEFESFVEGVLLHVGVPEGGTAPVDSILAVLGKEGEDISSLLTSSTPGTPVAAAAEIGENEPLPPSVSATSVTTEPTSGARILASPLAKSVAKEKGINLNEIKGTGEGGRIIKRDVENFAPGQRSSVVSSAVHGMESFEDVPLSQMRKTIARRLAESKFSAPHFYLTMDIDMDNAIQARKSIQDFGQAKVSFNDLVIKAAALALKKHPKVNASWLGDRIRYNHHVHIGVAVAIEDGLVVPVLKFADTLALPAINEQVKLFAQKAREKKIQPSDMEGNTFTISNLGMYGIEAFTAIINPPDSCIMAVGSIRQEPVVKNGAIVVGNRMKVTLSCDHRSVDGATGSEFLLTFRQLLENPVLMI